eukprot:7647113-Pyramimonas_sp.AAC.2
MGKANKATRKFQKAHLSGEIKRRKKSQQVNQWKKKRQSVGTRSGGGDDADEGGEEKKTSSAKKSLKEMDVDEFLESGFDMDSDSEGGGTDDEEDVEKGALESDEDESDVEMPQGFEEIETSSDGASDEPRFGVPNLAPS